MKSTTYIAEITTQKNKKKISLWEEKAACFLAWLPASFVLTKKFSVWVDWKVFWSIKLCDFSFFNWDSLQARLNTHYEE